MKTHVSRPPALSPADLAAIRAAITARRLAAGLSTYALARASGITPAALQKIEGGTGAPALGTLAQLARALACTLGELAPVPVPDRAGK